MTKAISVDYNYTNTSGDKCKRCGKRGYIGTNGLCSRCDGVVYGEGFK